jgi:hypothetical protein
MSDELKNILTNLNKDIRQDKLLEYLNSNLSDEETHELEMQLNDDEFMSDAAEGLKDLHASQKVPLMVQQLNAGLKKQLEKNKKRRSKRLLTNEGWVYFSIALLLLLAVIAFIVVKKMAVS